MYYTHFRAPQRVQFIDFEYGGYNPRGFDWGNHFCEYAGFDPDYEASYPSKPQQLHFLRRYVQSLPAKMDEGDKDEDENLFMEELCVLANRYACAAHLFWGYWAIIQVWSGNRLTRGFCLDGGSLINDISPVLVLSPILPPSSPIPFFSR